MRFSLPPSLMLLAIASAACASSGPRPIHRGPVPATQVEGSGELRASVGAFDPGRLATDDAAAEGVAAPGPESPWATFGLEVGSVSSAVDSTVRVGLAGAGVGLDLEDLLGLSRSNTTAKAKGYWRFSGNQRHRVDLSWLDLNRQGSKTVSQDINLGNGDVITAGTAATTRLDLRLIQAQYSYSFFQDDRVDLGVGGSLYVLPIDFQLEASGVSDASDSFGVTAPLPAVGLRFDFAINPRWQLQSDLNVFYIEFDDYAGALTNWSGGVEYRPWDHFALGLGLESFALRVEQNGTTDVPGVSEAGTIDLGYLGLGFSLRTRW
ncbi:MAG: hypothetical protein ISQ11_16700 [Planctomycetes bacterium]|nr:hypothetical protein [Planctomycetota bacterium]